MRTTDRPEAKALTAVDLDRLWSMPAHWHWSGSYRCGEDPRLMVRARQGMGWTLNMAHPRAQPLIWGILVCVIAGVVTMAILATGALR